jgi:hypothetical protein
MPYKDPDMQREYQNRCLQQRRLDWIASQGGQCVNCRSTEELEVDHVEPEFKINHRVWSWREDRRLEELKKCQVLCHVCHEGKTIYEKAKPLVHGTKNGYDKKKCRCEDCKGWNAARSRKQRSRHAPVA